MDILNPRTLYQTGMLNINTVLIRSSREERLRVVDGTVTIDLFSPETIQKIKQSGKHFAHVGLVVIGIKGLGRKLEDKCKEVTLQEQLKKSAYAFCKTAIYTPQAYGQYNKFKKKIRKSTTYRKEYKPYAGNKYVRKPQTRRCKKACICFKFSNFSGKSIIFIEM